MSARSQSDDIVLLSHKDNGVSWVTLNRPDKRNAMNLAARDRLIAVLDDCRESKVIVLTGNGPAFCAGVDLTESPSIDTGNTAHDRRSTWAGVQNEIRNHPSVVIAAVNGFALGGGSTLINVADLAVAAEDAQIGMPEIGFGLYPTLAGPAAQLRVSRKRAAWLILTAQRISGSTAADWGMVNASVPSTELEATVQHLADRIAGFDSAALKWSKRALWAIPDDVSQWDAAIEYGEHISEQIRFESDAFSAGLAGFRSGQRSQGQGT
jgi:enoyl-CoA hydratase/carnithine racemase